MAIMSNVNAQEQSSSSEDAATKQFIEEGTYEHNKIKIMNIKFSLSRRSCPVSLCTSEEHAQDVAREDRAPARRVHQVDADLHHHRAHVQRRALRLPAQEGAARAPLRRPHWHDRSGELYSTLYSILLTHPSIVVSAALSASCPICRWLNSPLDILLSRDCLISLAREHSVRLFVC